MELYDKTKKLITQRKVSYFVTDPEYRFHTYVMDVNNPDIYMDVFSRTLSLNLTKESIITEGAIKNGPGDSKDGFFIRVEFQN